MYKPLKAKSKIYGLSRSDKVCYEKKIAYQLIILPTVLSIYGLVSRDFYWVEKIPSFYGDGTSPVKSIVP